MAKKKADEDAPVLPPGIKLDPRGTRYYDILDSKSGERIIRVGHYQDPDIHNPEGVSRFMDFLPTFRDQVDRGVFKTLIFDGVSFASIAARKYSEYDLNEDFKDPRKHHGAATDMLEEMLACELPALACNVGVAMHVSKIKVEAEGSMVRAPHAPGRLRDMLAGAFPEVYRLHVVESEKEKGTKLRILQTDADDKWLAGTCIDAPDNMVVHRDDPNRTWERLWSKWKGDRHPWHGIIYSEPLAGKSTAFCMLPKPMYVALFDGFGKDAAYRRRGTLKIAA